MQSGQMSRIWLALGTSLAISGGVLIMMSLPAGGEMLWVGVGLVAVGSVALRRGMAGTSHKTQSSPGNEAELGAGTGGSRIERELQGPGPRQVRLTAKGKLVLGVWVLVLATFALLSHQHFGYLPAPPAKKLLDREGVTTSAKVHSRETRSMANGRDLYFLGYSFMVDSGTPMRVSQSVPARVHARVSEGDTTRIVYMPLNPEQHYLPELTSSVTTGMVVFIASVLLLSAGVAEAQRRLHRRLVVSGRAVAGFTANVRRRGGVRSYQVNYEVGGQRRALKTSERNAEVRDGQSVTVLFDPAIPSRAIVYRQAMYRAQP